MVKCTRSNFSEQLAFALGDATEATLKRLWVTVKFQLEHFFDGKERILFCQLSQG